MMTTIKAVCQIGASSLRSAAGCGWATTGTSGAICGSGVGCDSESMMGRISSYNERFGIAQGELMADVVIVSSVRTAIGKFQGALEPLSAPQLGSVVVREAVKRAKVAPERVDECIMGLVVAAGLGQNPARQAALNGGLPSTVGAMTINKVCGSGLKSVALAAQAIQTGNAEIVVAGGMESMTN